MQKIMESQVYFRLNVYNKTLAGDHMIVTAGGGRGARWQDKKRNFYNVFLLWFGYVKYIPYMNK